MNSTSLVKQAMLTLMSEKCFDSIFLQMNFVDVACLKAIISKCLGLALIAGSMIVKAPQIMKILGNKSAAGINFVNCLTDMYAVSTYVSYSFVKGFPFSSYGDGVFIGLQTLMITALVLYYNRSPALAYAFTATYMAFFYVMAGGLTPVNVLWSMQAVSVPIMFFGKMAQAFTNYQNKGTGQLSAATCALLLFGSLTRIFTSIQETGDFIVIFTYFLATVGNGVIVAQFVQYSGTKQKKLSKKTE